MIEIYIDYIDYIEYNKLNLMRDHIISCIVNLNYCKCCYVYGYLLFTVVKVASMTDYGIYTLHMKTT